MQAVYFDRTYHNETTARLWWDDHKAFFDTREQLIQHVLVSGRQTLKKVASRLRRSRTASGGSGGPPPSPWRSSRTRLPGDFAAATEATADLPLGHAERQFTNGMYPYNSTAPASDGGGGSGPVQRAEEPRQASQIFTSTQRFVAEHSPVTVDPDPYADDRGGQRFNGDVDGGDTGGRPAFQPPSQPLI